MTLTTLFFTSRQTHSRPSRLQISSRRRIQRTPGDDFDHDGVSNGDDEYPYNGERAFNSYQPAEHVYGTLAFEDLWPSKGDYDFNDLVIDYNYTLVLNAQNKVVDLNGEFVVKAVGAGFKNGFAFELPIHASQVENVTEIEVDHPAFSLSANNTESGQDNAVIIVFDNAYDIVQRPSGYFVNTQPGAPYVVPDTARAHVTFSTPLDVEDLGLAPFNPFIITNQRRGYEIHLPDHQPTSKADLSLLGTRP